jgi:hypothetical protein
VVVQFKECLERRINGQWKHLCANKQWCG